VHLDQVTNTGFLTMDECKIVKMIHCCRSNRTIGSAVVRSNKISEGTTDASLEQHILNSILIVDLILRAFCHNHIYTACREIRITSSTDSHNSIK
jgi:hypothetical protein